MSVAGADMHENHFRESLFASTSIKPFATRLRSLRLDFLEVLRTLGDTNLHILHRSRAISRLDDLESQAATLLEDFQKTAPSEDPTGKFGDFRLRLESFLAEFAARRGLD